MFPVRDCLTLKYIINQLLCYLIMMAVRFLEVMKLKNLALRWASLGLNAKTAKRAGLLHDIGKVPDDESELPHAIAGMKLAEKYGEKPDVCNAIGAHHDEIEMTSMLSPIVQACDAISGSRPGARREDTENYIKRLKDLEALAMSFKGVDKAFEDNEKMWSEPFKIEEVEPKG